jgi:hypothetical protein
LRLFESKGIVRPWERGAARHSSHNVVLCRHVGQF